MSAVILAFPSPSPIRTLTRPVEVLAPFSAAWCEAHLSLIDAEFARRCALMRDEDGRAISQGADRDIKAARVVPCRCWGASGLSGRAHPKWHDSLPLSRVKDLPEWLRWIFVTPPTCLNELFRRKKRLFQRLTGPTMTIWHTQAINAVWFVDPSHQADLAGLFEALTGFKPVTVQSSQVFLPSPVTTGFAQGAKDDCVYVLQINPGRMDFSMSPIAGKDAFSDTEKRVNEMANRVTGHSVSLAAKRLALLVNLIHEAADLPAANTLMRGQTDMDFPLASDQDFMFRINRRATLAGRECNRLLTWAVGQMQNVQIVVSVQPMAAGSLMPSALPPAPGASRFAALASVDVNTVPDPGTTFSVTDQQTIFAALAEEGLRLCRENRLGALT